MIGECRLAIYKSSLGLRRDLKSAGLALAATFLLQPSNLQAFEGRVSATITRGNQSEALLYTVGTNFLRVEMTATNWPNPVDIVDRNTGEMMLLFPNNRSFVRLKPVTENSSPTSPGFPQMPGGLPPGVGPQSPPVGLPAMPSLPAPQGVGPGNLPGMPAPPPMPAMPNLPPGLRRDGVTTATQAGVGLQTAAGDPAMPAMPPRPVMPNMPALPPGVGPQASTGPGAPGMSGGMAAMPAMPMMPPPMMERMELQDTGQKTNLLGFACEQYEIKQRGETMEIWATDQLFPFQPYVQNQPHRFGPRMIQEQWPGLVMAKKLFPLVATLKFDNGAERFRFEVKSVAPEKITEEDEQLFQPPANYFEIQPLPF
jgi:hypothetical protein